MLSRQAASLRRGAPTLARKFNYGPAHFALANQQKLFSTTFPAMSDAAGNTSGITAESLKAALTTRVDAQHVEVEDLSGT